ncbi:unnamed protein product [Alopecurus aequalis]
MRPQLGCEISRIVCIGRRRKIGSLLNINSGEVIPGGKRRRQVQAQGQPSLKLQKQKHLYLVLDDWADGFTIRKIDADDPDLSEAPAVRLASPSPLQGGTFFTSLGSYILAVSNQHPVSLVYDTATAAVAPGPSLPDALLNAYDIFVPTADNLCAFGSYMQERPPSVQVMSSSPATERHPCSSLIPCKDWSWRSVVPSPFTEEERIHSYAVHPDGRTVFVSSQFCASFRDDRSRTFSFNVSNPDEWRCHGDWELPFEGHGYFDSDLDAWVGLHRDGYIGTCQVPSRSTTSSTTAGTMRQQLDWKMAKDKLWSKDQQAAFEPTLTCLGNARFCLVDSLEEEEFGGDCMLRLTTFRLRHSQKGELQIIDRNTSSFPVYKRKNSFSPVAFWM